MLAVELAEDVFGALGDLDGRSDEAGNVGPALLRTNHVVAAVALDGVKEAAEIKVIALEDDPPREGSLAEVGFEEAAVLEAEGGGVAGGRSGLEAVDGLGLGGEGERGAVEGEGGVPGPGRDYSANAKGLGQRANLEDESQRVREFLLGGVEDGCLRDDGGGGG